MSTNDSNLHGDAALQLQLRALRRDALPGNDLWPGIAARIGRQARDDRSQPQATAPAGGNVVPLRRRPAAGLAPFAVAASLVLAVGVAWQQRPDVAARGSAPLVQREAEALTREYEAALRELQSAGNPAAPMGDTLRHLDSSAAQIRAALRRDPAARFLLGRLRHTYEKRLELTQYGLTQRAALEREMPDRR